ncbi:protein of unknown function [Agromyces sp. CF514]|uniref:WxL protein peptidoglycan domain-containing protein n=1 Tax=Agromyces sp. CF514 TaxID=1881031 RepID=UPI0008F030ED|nr:DUF916 domain-containing protein [Agromyces sp. CF514]SFR68372.1 protein of unknown function [Agromyces sp. CF514]
MRTAPATDIRPPHRRRVARSVLLAAGLAAALAAALAVAAPAAPASAEDGPEVTWGVRTADTSWGDGRENYAYAVDAGETVEDALIIANHDVVPIELDVYAADAFTTADGLLDVATRDVRPRELGAWAVPAADRVTVQPGEAVEVPFTITVPANATPGDHAGGILTALADPEVDSGLKVDRRLGIRIHLRVGGELAPALAVDDLHVEYAGTPNPFGTGAATVTYTVRNAGNTRLAAAQDVALTGPFGMLPVAAADVADVPELLPGETWPVEVHVDGVIPAFVLTAAVALDPVSPTESEPAPKSVEESASTAAVPWTLLVLVLLLAAGIVVWVRLARRRRAQRKVREDARVQEAVDRALREREAQAGAVAEPAPEPLPEPEPEPEPEPAGRP